ncbi:MAG: metal ABC transporter permease [Vulcanimicrobiota bacterium]
MQILEVFNESFMQIALIASVIIGVTTSYIGVLVVLRRIIFVGIALAHFSSLGIAVAAYFHQDMMTFSLVFTALGVVIMAPRDYAKRIPSDAVIGVGLASCWALSILFLSKADHGDAEMLTLMRGNILGATPWDIHILCWVLGSVLLLHCVFSKEFLFISFDAEAAQASGMKTSLWNFLFYLSLGVSIAVSIKLAGVLLTFSYLLFPAVVSMLLSEKIKTTIVISVAVSLCASVFGLVASFLLDFPTAPAIVTVLFIFFITVFVIFNLKRWCVKDEGGQRTGNSGNNPSERGQETDRGQ